MQTYIMCLDLEADRPPQLPCVYWVSFILRRLSPLWLISVGRSLSFWLSL